MKLTALANEYLKFMAKSYSETHKRTFSFQQFKELHPELDNRFISDALYLLESDALVSVFPADNVAYLTTLLPTAIRQYEENTLLKKGYTCIKEIASWF